MCGQLHSTAKTASAGIDLSLNKVICAKWNEGKRKERKENEKTGNGVDNGGLYG